MQSKLRYNKGFSLLEVMIALAIVSIALISLLGLSNRSILVQATVQKLTTATMLAQQVINEQELQGGSITATWKPQTEVFEPPYGDYSWDVSYQETLIPQVKQITVVVLWGDADKNEQVRLVSFVPMQGSR